LKFLKAISNLCRLFPFYVEENLAATFLNETGCNLKRDAIE
jgi:hypothetical protein